MSFEGDLPLYQQLAELLKEGISTGRYKQGQKLPTELELCELYHVSRNTVRGALRQLEKENLLLRQQGKGTFVSKKKYNHHIVPARSFTDMCREIGCKADAKVIQIGHSRSHRRGCFLSRPAPRGKNHRH